MSWLSFRDRLDLHGESRLPPYLAPSCPPVLGGTPRPVPGSVGTRSRPLFCPVSRVSPFVPSSAFRQDGGRRSAGRVCRCPVCPSPLTSTGFFDLSVGLRRVCSGRGVVTTVPSLVVGVTSRPLPPKPVDTSWTGSQESGLRTHLPGGFTKIIRPIPTLLGGVWLTPSLFFGLLLCTVLRCTSVPAPTRWCLPRPDSRSRDREGHTCVGY